MKKFCTQCGFEGGYFNVKMRKLPSSPSKILCNVCYNKIYEDEKEELRKIERWIEKIARRFYEGTLKQFCREHRISVSEKRERKYYSKRGNPYYRTYTYYFTYEELVEKVKNYGGINDVIDFAHRKKIDISDITPEIDKDKIEKEFAENDINNKIDDDKFQEIIREISSFEPLFNDYCNELPYHIDLARYLMQKYPNTNLELQRGSARPDIVIDNIAIEIKGPTDNRELQTIADKCLRYTQYFDRGLIIVLFDVRVTNSFYNDWKNGIEERFSNVKIIRK